MAGELLLSHFHPDAFFPPLPIYVLPAGGLTHGLRPTYAVCTTWTARQAGRQAGNMAMIPVVLTFLAYVREVLSPAVGWTEAERTYCVSQLEWMLAPSM